MRRKQPDKNVKRAIAAGVGSCTGLVFTVIFGAITVTLSPAQVLTGAVFGALWGFVVYKTMIEE